MTNRTEMIEFVIYLCGALYDSTLLPSGLLTNSRAMSETVKLTKVYEWNDISNIFK